MSDPARVLQDALGLEPGDRARIARELIVSLEKEDADAEELWRKEIRHRIDDVESGTAPLDDWGTVRARLRAMVRP